MAKDSSRYSKTIKVVKQVPQNIAIQLLYEEYQLEKPFHILKLLLMNRQKFNIKVSILKEANILNE